jgi:hypothetical protein
VVETVGRQYAFIKFGELFLLRFELSMIIRLTISTTIEVDYRNHLFTKQSSHPQIVSYRKGGENFQIPILPVI